MHPIRTILLAGAIALFSQCALAQSFPTKPVRILVAYAPGGPADIAARLVGAKLSELWAQQVVVENRPGGNGFIAMSAVAKAPADGYTLIMATIGEVAIVPALYKDAPYNVQKDFAPIALVSDATIVLAASANAPYKNVADVIAAAKTQPLSVSSPGNGTVNHLVIEWLAISSGAKFTHIPYKGSALGATALAGGEVALGMLASSSVAPHLKSGRVKVLAVTGSRRSSFGPEWPTLQQEGFKDISASTWTALLAPAGTPQPVIERINADVVKVLNMPDIKEKFAAGGVETIPSTPAELDARIKQDAAQFAAVVQKAGIKVE
jgi:tripartite-type tricarboxylate transporter receptor subunit TctC